MGRIICRASVSVVGLSTSAGHSSGVAPFPGVEDDSLPERSRDRAVIFKQRHTPWPAGERRPHTRPWPAGPGWTRPGPSARCGRRPSRPGGPHRPFLSPH